MTSFYEELSQHYHIYPVLISLQWACLAKIADGNASPQLCTISPVF